MRRHAASPMPGRFGLRPRVLRSAFAEAGLFAADPFLLPAPEEEMRIGRPGRSGAGPAFIAADPEPAATRTAPPRPFGFGEQSAAFGFRKGM